MSKEIKPDQARCQKKATQTKISTDIKRNLTKMSKQIKPDQDFKRNQKVYSVCFFKCNWMRHNKWKNNNDWNKKVKLHEKINETINDWNYVIAITLEKKLNNNDWN